jgi:hypothetical protein
MILRPIFHFRTLDSKMIANWDEKIVQLFKDFADEDLQRRSWFGIGPEVSSPTEMCCSVEDLDMEGWRIHREPLIGLLLSGMIEDFMSEVEHLPADIDDWTIFASSEWIKIRLMASVIRDLLMVRIDRFCCKLSV